MINNINSNQTTRIISSNTVNQVRLQSNNSITKDLSFSVRCGLNYYKNQPGFESFISMFLNTLLAEDINPKDCIIEKLENYIENTQPHLN